MKLLRSRDVDVYLVSGGFDTLIEPVARELNIPVENIYANKLKYFFDGTFANSHDLLLESQANSCWIMSIEIQEAESNVHF